MKRSADAAPSAPHSASTSWWMENRLCGASGGVSLTNACGGADVGAALVAANIAGFTATGGSASVTGLDSAEASSIAGPGFGTTRSCFAVVIGAGAGVGAATTASASALGAAASTGTDIGGSIFTATMCGLRHASNAFCANGTG